MKKIMSSNETFTLDDFNANQPVVLNSNFTVCKLQINTQSIIASVIFTIIFCLSVVGNSMVVMTIVQNRWMRTVTNLYLLNLAITDLLLTLICMPHTLLAMLFKCFLWSNAMCKIIAYMQPVSVAACSFTLVAIAFERYNAICRPLHSRHWKTKKHALFMICSVWTLSFLCTSPSIIMTDVQKIGPAKIPNCREEWPSKEQQLVYLIFLTFCLLLLPLIVMCVLYCLVTVSLWKGIRVDVQGTLITEGDSFMEYEKLEEKKESDGSVKSSLSAQSNKIHRQNPPKSLKLLHSPRPIWKEIRRKFSKMPNSATNSRRSSLQDSHQTNRTDNNETHPNNITSSENTILRSTHTEQNLASKKLVIKMLAVIVAEFFLCMTPIYVYTLYIAIGGRYTHELAVTFLTLTYLSTCTNPVTYCFMNGKFRNAFLVAFGCRFLVKNSYAYPPNSTASCAVPHLMMAAKKNYAAEEKRRLSRRRNATTTHNYVGADSACRRNDRSSPYNVGMPPTRKSFSESDVSGTQPFRRFCDDQRRKNNNLASALDAKQQSIATDELVIVKKESVL